MKLPSIKRINKTDYEEKEQEMVEKLSYAINYNFDKVWNVLNGQVSLKDNTYTQLKDITVEVNSSGVPMETISFTSTFTPARPIGAIVIDVQNTTNPTSYLSNAPFISYSESNGVITIDHITGLSASNKYKLKIVFFG